MKKFRKATFKIKLDESPNLTPNENYLIATVYATRRGVFDYYQGEKLYREYRSEEEVFKVDSMNTLKNQPLTRLHPQKMLSSKNASQHIKGIVLQDVSQEGDYIKATVKVMDQALIDEILTGKLTELSCGYKCEVLDKSGVTDRGEEYDGVQKDIVYNHLAVVPKGRAGANVRFKLDAQGNQDLSEEGYEENFDNDDNNEKGQEEMKITFNGKEYDLSKADEKAKYDAAVQLDAQEKKDVQEKFAKAQVELDMLKADQANQPQKLAQTLAFIAQVKPYLKADSTDEELIKKDAKELKKQAVIDNYPNIPEIDKKEDSYYEVAYQFMLDNVKPKKDKAPAPQTPPAQKNDGITKILNGKADQNNDKNTNTGDRTDSADTKLDEALDPSEVAYLQSLKRDSEAWITKE